MSGLLFYIRMYASRGLVSNRTSYIDELSNIEVMEAKVEKQRDRKGGHGIVW